MSTLAIIRQLKIQDQKLEQNMITILKYMRQQKDGLVHDINSMRRTLKMKEAAFEHALHALADKEIIDIWYPVKRRKLQ